MAKKILIIILIVWGLVFIMHHAFVGSFAGPGSDMIIIVIDFFVLNIFSLLLALALYNNLNVLKNISFVLLTLLLLVNVYYGLDKSYKFFFIWKANQTIVASIEEYKMKNKHYPSEPLSSNLTETGGFKRGRGEYKEFDYLEGKGDHDAFEIYYPLNAHEGWVYISKTERWSFSD
jgi:membrane-bound ClpP family serine protease